MMRRAERREEAGYAMGVVAANDENKLQWNAVTSTSFQSNAVSKLARRHTGALAALIIIIIMIMRRQHRHQMTSARISIS
jgi:hypothetical protein